MDLTGTIKDNMFAIMKGESCGYNQLTYPLISAHPLALRELDKSHPWGAVLFCGCGTDFLYSKQINTVCALPPSLSPVVYIGGFFRYDFKVCRD